MTAPPNRPPGKGSEDPDDNGAKKREAVRLAMMVSLFVLSSTPLFPTRTCSENLTASATLPTLAAMITLLIAPRTTSASSVLMSYPWTMNTRTVTAVTEAKVRDTTTIDTVKRLRLPLPVGTRRVATPGE